MSLLRLFRPSAKPAASRRTPSCKPTLEALEAREVAYGAGMGGGMTGGAVESPLTGAAAKYLYDANVNMRNLKVILVAESMQAQETGHVTAPISAAVGRALRYERSLENGMRLLEKYEQYYESYCYDGAQFQSYARSFHLQDGYVKQQAVIDMQFFHHNR